MYVYDNPYFQHAHRYTPACRFIYVYPYTSIRTMGLLCSRAFTFNLPFIYNHLYNHRHCDSLILALISPYISLLILCITLAAFSVIRGASITRVTGICVFSNYYSRWLLCLYKSQNLLGDIFAAVLYLKISQRYRKRA